jgi:hypothetical protein
MHGMQINPNPDSDGHCDLILFMMVTYSNPGYYGHVIQS